MGIQLKFQSAFFALLLLLPVAAQADPQQGNSLHDGLTAEKNKDYKTALKILRPLAETGNADAEFEIGWMYEFGRGVPQDYRLALSWFKKAALQGHNRAEQDLGVMYAAGQGGKQDIEEAVFWEALASKSPGAPWPSVDGVGDGLVSQLAPEQITAVKKRLEKWKPIDPGKELPPDPPDGQRPLPSKP